MIFNIDIRPHGYIAPRIHIVINLGYDFDRNDRRKLCTHIVRADLKFCEA